MTTPIHPARETDASSAPAHAAEHPQAGARTYLVIAAFLFLLTIMEVAVFYVPALQKDPKIFIPVLILLALAKFALVALFYMHLRFDHVWFAYLFVPPLIIVTGLGLALLWLFGLFGTTGMHPGGSG